MIKVAVVADTWFPFVGGGQINAWEISRRLAQKGFEFDIITRNLGRENLKYPQNIHIIKLGEKAKPLDFLSRLFFLFRAYNYISKQKYDIIHGQAFLPGLILLPLKIFKNIPTVFTVHGTSLGTDLNTPFKKFIEWVILTKIPYTIQITVSRDFKNISNINRNLKYIPSGVDVTNFDSFKTVKPNRPTLIFVGRLHSQKNLPNLLKALPNVKKHVPNIMLKIIGDGQEKELLINTVKNLRLQNNVDFLDQISGSNLIKLYKSSSIFVLPSIYEGLPLTLLEAWAAKIPAIVSNTGDCSFLVRDGINGYLINDPTNPSEIADSVLKALQAKNLQQMGQNGYNLVAKNFSWEKSAQKTLKLYESLTKTKN